jgi:hypothetical protein
MAQAVCIHSALLFRSETNSRLKIIFRKTAKQSGCGVYKMCAKGAKGKKVMQAILEQNHISKNINNRTKGVFGEKISVLGKVFGCWHRDLTRPFTAGNVSYRACTECGARRRFDEKSFKTYGSFYHPPAISLTSNRR